jgi:hypothetical protein
MGISNYRILLLIQYIKGVGVGAKYTVFIGMSLEKSALE